MTQKRCQKWHYKRTAFQRVTLGSVSRAVHGITVGHEMVGIVEEVGSEVKNVRPGDRVTVNVLIYSR